MKESFKESKLSGIALTLNFLFVVIYLFTYLRYKSVTAQTLGLVDYTVRPFWLILPIASLILYKLASSRDSINFLKKANFWITPYVQSLAVFFFLGSFFKFFLGTGLLLFLFVGMIFTSMSFKNKKKDFYEYLSAFKTDNIKEIKANPGDFVIGEIYKKNVGPDGHTPEGEDDYIPSSKKAVLPLRDRFVHVLALGVTGSGKTSQSLLPMYLGDFTSDNFRFADVDVVQMGQIVLEPKGDFAKTVWSFGKIKESEKRYNYIGFLVKVPERLNAKIAELQSQRNEYLLKKNGRELSPQDAKEMAKLHQEVSSASFHNKKQEDQISSYARYEHLKKMKDGEELSKEEADALVLIEDSLKKLLFIRHNLPNYLTLEFKWLSELSTFALFRYSSLMTDIIANPASSEISWNDLVNQNPHEKRDVVMLFDPSSKESPYFNPLYGDEETAVGTVTSTLIAFMADSGDYFKNLSKTVLQNAIHVVKRVYKNDATLIHVNDLLTNNGGRGDEMLRKLGTLNTRSEAEALQNRDYQAWFQNIYYAGLKGLKGGGKEYDNSSGVRNILSNLLDSSRLRKVLCPPPGIGTDIDFDKILRTGDKVALSTATGISDEIGRMLGSFLILQLQAAIFRRPGTENTRPPVILYIDEFQDYASSSFEDVLTKGRSYVVSATMATQTLGIVGSKAGMGLVENLQSNARNVIVYPGSSSQDADYFVSLFGTTEETYQKQTISQEMAPEGLQKLNNIRKTLGIGEVDKPRESLSEETKSVDRFSKAQVMYGPNQRTRGIGSNDAFGYIYYRIIVHNNVQTPAVAKINYIPRDIKVASDKLVAAYDANHRLKPGETDDEIETVKDVVDPFKGESAYKEESISNLTLGTNKESDPMSLAIHLNGKTEDLSATPDTEFKALFTDEIGIEDLGTTPPNPSDFESGVPDDVAEVTQKVDFDNFDIEF